MRCKVCQEEYHDTCPLIEGCSCCEWTMKQIEDESLMPLENTDEYWDKILHDTWSHNEYFDIMCEILTRNFH